MLDLAQGGAREGSAWEVYGSGFEVFGAGLGVFGLGFRVARTRGACSRTGGRPRPCFFFFSVEGSGLLNLAEGGDGEGTAWNLGGVGLRV